MKKILFSLMALACLATASAQTPKENYDEGVKALQGKDFPKAAALFESIVASDNGDESMLGMVTAAKTYLPQIYYWMGGRSAQGGDYNTARDHFEKSAELAELYDDIANMMKARGWIGKTYELQGGELFNDKNYTTALPIFEAGYEADPRNAKMANWLGICYCETGEYNKGMEIFTKVSTTRSNQYAEEPQKAKEYISMYTNNRVAALQEKKDYNGLIAFADQLSAQDPQSALAAKVRIQAYSDQKAYGKIIAAAEAAAALQTSAEEKSNIYFILAAAYNAQENKDQAIATFKKVTAGANVAKAKETIAELSK